MERYSEKARAIEEIVKVITNRYPEAWSGTGRRFKYWNLTATQVLVEAIEAAGYELVQMSDREEQ